MTGRPFKISLLVFILLAASGGLGCPTYWTPFGNSCYRFFGQRVTLDEARYNCRIHGSGTTFAHLASIHSQEENDFLGTLYKSHTETAEDGDSWHVWIGLNDEEEEGTFVWSDGSSFDFRSWSPGQPDGRTSQQGVNMPHPNHISYGFWHDNAVTARNKYICKMPRDA